jgi:hypothetical protein
MKRPVQLLLFISVLTLLIATGCYPDKIDYVSEYDVAATHYDEDADFSLYTTFSVIDTIIHLTDDGEDDPNFSRDHDEFILGLLRDNMSNRGYTEIENPDSLNRPDLVLLVEALSSDYYSYYFYDYWSWYPGWDWWYPWYPGYPGYPWYPSYPWYPGYVSSYSTGTLMIEMADTESFDPEDRTLGFVWGGLIDGLLVKSSENTRTRLETQINQLFIQSPYLQK